MAFFLPMENELSSWIQLTTTPGIGSKTLQSLLTLFSQPSQIIARAKSGTLTGMVAQSIITGINNRNQQLIDKTLQWADSPQNSIVTWSDPRYPTLLREIPDPPHLLYVQGDPHLLQSTQLAIVGTRHPTNLGASLANRFAADLATSGITITSGLALGIDSAAHQGAIDSNGKTIAVTATGLDIVYPARHKRLAASIAEQGAIISEFPLGTQPNRRLFPSRNRIISGLSYGVLVVEAALKSGSLITAMHALEQNRDVFAIPGSIHNPLAKGCHKLIQQGAKLVDCTQDIINEIALPEAAIDEPILPEQKNIQFFSETPCKKQVLDFIEFTPTSADTIIMRSGLTAETVSAMLLILELEGMIIAEPGGMFIRTT